MGCSIGTHTPLWKKCVCAQFPVEPNVEISKETNASIV